MAEDLADQLTTSGTPRRGLGRGLGAILPSHNPRPLGVLLQVAGRHLGPRPAGDPLTGLANRPELIERLDEALQQAQRERTALAVVVLGLDGFRHVNAMYGHSVGDTLLRDLGSRLAASRRAGDLVARLGGDEFAMVCPRVGSPESGCRMAGRLREEMAAPLLVDQVEHRLEATMGLVVTEPGVALESGRALLRRAHLAMQRAKDAGERWAMFEPLIDAHQRPRWNSSSVVRTGRPAEAPGRSSEPGSPISTAPR